jgi:uncharacterized phage-associated protein
MLNPFTFDEKVAVEAILYIAKRSKDPTFHHIAKLFYFADLCHLERYGRFICGDRYVAMKHGPVPSGIYDMLKAARDGVGYLHFDEIAHAFSVKENRLVVPLRPSNLEWLSDSDIGCLDEAITNYDHLGFDELTRKSHDIAWKSADVNRYTSLPIWSW